MPWTDESDPPSRPTPGQSRAPNASLPETGLADSERSKDASAEAPPHEDRSKAPGSTKAGPWGASIGAASYRAPKPERKSPSRKAAPARPAAAGLGLDALAQALRIRAARLLARPVRRGLRLGVLVAALSVAAATWGLSGLYEVAPDERAVVTRLGAIERVMGPGLSYHLPWPFERAQSVVVTRINTLALGAVADDGSQALTPTADGQLADVVYSVHWRISNPVAYLFQIADPQQALKLSAEAAMRRAVGARPLAVVMNGDRAQLQRQIAMAIQQRLNGLDAGCTVTGVLIQAVDLPPEVQAAAQDVDIARQEAETAIEDAKAYRVRTLAQAEATAAKTLIDAQSYRDQTVREAQGAAARFDQLDAAYRRAPGVTKDRLYFETLQGVLARAHTVILDPAKGATVALPPDLLRVSPSAPPDPPTAAQTRPQTNMPSGAASTAHGAGP